jgi:hypothetical protein
MEYTTGMSKWLRFISIKGIFDSRYDQVLEVSSKTQLMEKSYNTHPIYMQTQFG